MNNVVKTVSAGVKPARVNITGDSIVLLIWQFVLKREL